MYRLSSTALLVALLVALLAGCQSPPFASSRIDPPVSDDRRLADDDLSEPSQTRKSPTKNDEVETVSRAGYEVDAEESAASQVQLASAAMPAERTPPPEPDDLARAHTEAARGHLDQAKLLYRRVLQQQPRQVQAHHGLAVIADRQQDFVSAEHHYQAALRLDAANADLWSDLGYSYLLQGKLEQSERALSEAVRLEPGHVRGLNNLALVAAARGDAQQALAIFRQTGTEADAQAKLAQLFPQGFPPGTASATYTNTLRPLQAPLPRSQQIPPGPPTAYTGMPIAGGTPIPHARFTDVHASSTGTTAPMPAQPNLVQSNVDEGPRPAVSAMVGPSATAPTGPPAIRQEAAGSLAAPPSVNPLDSMAEWPPSSTTFASQATMPDRWPGRATSPPATALPVISPRPVGTAATAMPSAAHSGYPHQTAPQMTITPRQTPAQRAALLGMQAGPGGMFPIGMPAATSSSAGTPVVPGQASEIPTAGYAGTPVATLPVPQPTTAAGFVPPPTSYMSPAYAQPSAVPAPFQQTPAAMNAPVAYRQAAYPSAPALAPAWGTAGVAVPPNVTGWPAGGVQPVSGTMPPDASPPAPYVPAQQPAPTINWTHVPPRP